MYSRNTKTALPGVDPEDAVTEKMVYATGFSEPIVVPESLVCEKCGRTKKWVTVEARKGPEFICPKC